MMGIILDGKHALSLTASTRSTAATTYRCSASMSPESVGLIYLDPPFNSQARYNVAFHVPGSNPEPN
jgi:hypothetical protein